MALPLLRQFFILDMEVGTLVVHQVRRRPHTGLTFTQRASTSTSSNKDGRP